MRRYLSRLLGLVLVVCIGLMGCSSISGDVSGLTGDYHQDTLALVSSLRAALQVPDDAPERIPTQTQARQLINDFAARYRRDSSLTKLPSYTTIRTALNSLAGHYSSYPNRPVPQKMKDRLEQEFKQVEVSINRGA